MSATNMGAHDVRTPTTDVDLIKLEHLRNLLQFDVDNLFSNLDLVSALQSCNNSAKAAYTFLKEKKQIQFWL